MAGIILFLMVVLYFYGYVQIPGVSVPNPTLFIINGQTISLAAFLVFFTIIWTLSVLPPVLRIIGILLLVAWTLTQLGVFVIAGLSNFIALAVIVSLFVIIFR